MIVFSGSGVCYGTEFLSSLEGIWKPEKVVVRILILQAALQSLGGPLFHFIVVPC